MVIYTSKLSKEEQERLAKFHEIMNMNKSEILALITISEQLRRTKIALLKEERERIDKEISELEKSL